MIYEYTSPSINRKKCILLFIYLVFITTFINAQDVLVGLTSNGGPEGRGTVFSVKTAGTNFSILKGFADWGKAPNGSFLLGDDGNFYGMTSSGGTYNYGGSIFRMTASGAITVLKQFNGTTDGGSPYGELIKGPDGNFWGVTSAGGTNTYGTIFKITPAGTYTVLKSFSYATDGTNPHGHLVLGNDGNFYGITTGGGPNGVGTIFKYTPGGVFTVLHSFNKTTDGSNSYGSLTEGTDGNLYGITYGGGTYGNGTIFKVTKSGVFTVLRHLDGTTDGGASQGDLVQATDGNFYGMCYSGGINGNGTIFKITPSGTYKVLKALASQTNGGNPYGNLFQNSDGFLYGMTKTGGAKSAGTIFKISTAGAFTVIHSFDAPAEGSGANGGLIKGKDGNLYGMTSSGGINQWGTAFKVTTSGVLTVLASFNGATAGNAPYETLVKGKDSAYYGTTSSGGKYNYGTIFKICGGVTTVLHSFNRNAEGGTPRGSLIQATDGNFYGTTTEGGNGSVGTIFKITAAGVYSVIKHLNAATDGASPQGSLVQGTDGFLYGMTNSGGANTGGTVFKMNFSGSSFTVLRALAYATDGANPEGNLIQGTDGSFYGLTNNNSRMFKVTSAGAFTVLHTFISGTEGSYPVGSLVQGKDGNFYGTTSSGGTNSSGTIFKITPSGTLNVLKHLNGTTDGKTPKGNLVQTADGNFYGMTSTGGNNSVGTLFKITPSGTYTVLRHFDMALDGGNPYGSLIVAPVNNLVANAQTVTTNEDTKQTITLTGSGGSPLGYYILTNPQHGTITGTSDTRTYTPNKNYTGSDQFSFIVSVGCMSSLPATVNITITPVADTPVLAPIGNKSVVVNSTLTFKATATDPDAGQTLTYSLVGAPSGATINASTGAFSWKPTTTGSYNFKVRVTDNGTPPLYDEEQITVTVTNTLVLSVAVTQLAASKKLRATMYPNPVTDKFYVSIPGASKQITLSIVDMNGIIKSSVVYQASAKNNIQVNASGLSSGLYLLRISTDEAIETLKFIKR